MSLRDTITSALQSTPGADEIKEILQQAGSRRAEVTSRLSAIRPTKGANSAGTLRQEALLTGTPEELAAMDRECELLAAELDQLRAWTTELGNRQRAVAGQEAVDHMPDCYKALDAMLKDARKARDAYGQALREVEVALRKIEQARHEANLAGIGRDVPPAPAELYQCIDALRSGANLDAPLLWGPHSNSMLEDILGVPRPRRDAA